jgi:aspartyl-tRNA(Asn)/glutamyl-tRNA(Gln) amidotransferase subunit C
MNKEELRLTAELARLHVTEEELDKLSAAVSEMITYFSKMSELKVDHLLPTTHALFTKNRVRNDIPLQFNSDLLLDNAQEVEERFIVIPNVL